MQEVQPWGVSEYTVLEGSHKSFNTRRAAIDLITNPYYGRMLFIDGVLQSTSSDEKIYHGELIKELLRENPKTVLIAGGAEGALARQVLSGSVSKVVMVDWDEELVSAMKDEHFACGAFEDPRIELVHHDIFEYVKGCERFDYILLDLLDPGLDDIDWLVDLCERCLKKTTKLSMNAGGDKEIVRTIMDRLEREGAYIVKRKINVPSFQQEWYLIDIDVYYT
jgi:spermidine synthase